MLRNALLLDPWGEASDGVAAGGKPGQALLQLLETGAHASHAPRFARSRAWLAACLCLTEIYLRHAPRFARGRGWLAGGVSPSALGGAPEIVHQGVLPLAHWH
eukprot:COSAG01_NODE_9729_length_2360_cov_23.362749_1_plen_103_part_00